MNLTPQQRIEKLKAAKKRVEHRLDLWLKASVGLYGEEDADALRMAVECMERVIAEEGEQMKGSQS